MDFEFIPPAKLKRNERRVIARHLADQLVARLAERAGLPHNQVSLLKDGERIRGRTRDGRQLEFKPVEEQAIVEAQEWERTGVGEGPKLPL